MKRNIKINFEETVRATPMPFPGVYPTRWWINFVYKDAAGNAQTFQYNGKPNTALAVQLKKKLLQKRQGYLMVTEYDRGGAFRRAIVACPAAIYGWYEIPHLAVFYYPDTYNADFATAWADDFKRVALIYKGGRYMTYWRVPPQPADLTRHKLWLPKSDLKFK